MVDTQIRCPLTIHSAQRSAKCLVSIRAMVKLAGLEHQTDRGLILHTRQDPNWRLCKWAPETLQHFTGAPTRYKILARKEHMECHNRVSGIVYRNICLEYKPKTPRSKLDTPPKVEETDKAKILFDFQIQTDKIVMANQQDIPITEAEDSRL